MDIILYLLQLIQELYQINRFLLFFVCKYIPLKQWAYDDLHSPKYQKFKVDRLPVIKTFLRQDWQFLLEYYQWKYHKPVRPVQRRSDRSSLKTSSALSVALLIITSMIITAATANISVRSVDRLSPAGNMSPLPSVSSVPTAAIPLSRKRTGSFSASTNVSTRTALFISIISKKWKTNICCPLTEDQDINFTISIGNLPWISFAWILTPSLSLYHILTTPFFPYGISLYFLFYPYLYLIIIIYQLLSNGKNYLEIKCFFVKKRC